MRKICLVGNPNAGKSTVFNLLTGLHQKVSNFPGVTVEKNSGTANINGKDFEIVDLPGTYSLYPNSNDERITSQILTNPSNEAFPDIVLNICDINQLDRHLLLASQLKDLGIPMLLLLNMADLYNGNMSVQNIAQLVEDQLHIPTLAFSSNTSDQLPLLKEKISSLDLTRKTGKSFFSIPPSIKHFLPKVSQATGLSNDYANLLILHHYPWLDHLSDQQSKALSTITGDNGFESTKEQINETLTRFEKLSVITNKLKNDVSENKDFTNRIDKILTHPIIGPVIFLLVMLFMFQSIYAWSEAPMTWIEDGFGWLGNIVTSNFPESWVTDLIVDGLIAGLGGVLVFIPQITILFLLIAILEESGYMSRAVYLFDPFMRRFGLNGRSMVALISSGACAIPAIMSTRTISNWKERLITIMVSPLISCSARIPVYAILVGFVVPNEHIGPFNLQGLVFMGLYLLGILGALISAIVFKFVLKSSQPSFLMLELPTYKKPKVSNVLIEVKRKVSSFIIGAGKIILLISILLWLLASYGPKDAMHRAEKEALQVAQNLNLSESEYENVLASNKIEASYAGHIGKFIEPAIKPLGMDWKMGIALITSFAAREVFVGTMATIYSIGSEDNEDSLREKMRNEMIPGTSLKVYSPATALSLLIFYVFAMQCMSTLAVTKRETNSWKWPTIQFLFMGILAYVGSFITYQLIVPS